MTNKLEYHLKYALKDNNIGIINYWAFKDKYLFLNYEKGIIEKLKNIKEVEIISSNKFDKLYDERNIHEGNEREQQYGKVHEAWLEIWTEGTTKKSGKWTMEFCREIAMTKATIEFQKALIKIGVFRHKDLNTSHQSLAKNYLFGNGCTYMDYCDKMMEEELSENDILDIIKEYKQMPPDWKILNKNSEEINFYLKHPTLDDDNEDVNVDYSLSDNKIFSELLTDKLMTFLKNRKNYINNLSLEKILLSLNSECDNEKKIISKTQEILELYNIDKNLSSEDKEQIIYHKKSLEEANKNLKFRTQIISIINLSNDKSIKIQEYFENILNNIESNKI